MQIVINNVEQLEKFFKENDQAYITDITNLKLDFR